MFYHALTGNGATPEPIEDLEPVLLWENSNPAAEFAAQTVSLDLTDYAGVLVEFNSANDQLILATRSYLSKSDTINKDHFGAGHVGGSAGGIGRNYYIDNSGVVFANAYYLNNVSNNAMIPTKIYGVKEYVVEPVNNLQLITTSQNKAVSFTAEDNVNYLVIESAYNGSGAVNIRECSVDNGELEVLKHLVESNLETYTALIKNAVGTVNYSSVATSDSAMILIFKLVG